MKIFTQYKSIGNWFILLIVNAFFMLFFANVLSAQCRYIPKTNETQTRAQIIVGAYGMSNTLTAKARKTDEQIFLDIHFETQEKEFSIKKDATLTLILVNGEIVILHAIEMLHSDAYKTCCDTVWLMEVAYLIPKNTYILISENNLTEIHLELDNRLEKFVLKNKRISQSYLLVVFSHFFKLK